MDDEARTLADGLVPPAATINNPACPEQPDVRLHPRPGTFYRSTRGLRPALQPERTLRGHHRSVEIDAAASGAVQRSASCLRRVNQSHMRSMSC